MFFHQYFSRKNENEKAKGEKVAKRKVNPDGKLEDGEGDFETAETPKDVSENEEDEKSEGEAEIWKVCSFLLNLCRQT